MGWYDHVKKYVWDEEKTPYFISVSRLTKAQAKNELFVYTLFLGTVCALITIASWAGADARGTSAPTWMGPYALSLVCSAIMLGLTKHPYAAWYCATAPVTAFLAILSNEWRPDHLAAVDRYVLLGITLLWLVYALRVVTIARAFQGMPEKAPGR